jgi:hypothetical protein
MNEYEIGDEVRANYNGLQFNVRLLHNVGRLGADALHPLWIVEIHPLPDGPEVFGLDGEKLHAESGEVTVLSELFFKGKVRSETI